MIHYCDESFNFFFTQNKLSCLISAARGSSILIRLFRKITFQAAKNTIALDMTNRIIKSLDCREIILIFCILQVDFAISIITLFVIFDESFQKALVDKSVCVINIVHLIFFPATKNPLFDVYFNRITALLAVIFFPVMRAYLRPFTLFAVSFLSVMGAYLSPSAIFAVSFLPVMPTYFSPSAIFALIFIFSVSAKIFQIFRFSVFVHISYFFFHFYIKQKN